MSVIVHLTDHGSILVIEATLLWPILDVRMAKMPLADDRRRITRLLEALGHEILAGVQPITALTEDNRRLKTITERVTPRHQCSSRRSAHGLNIKLGKLHAALCKRIEVGCLDVRAAIETDVFPPEVISNDVNNVGLSGRMEACGG